MIRLALCAAILSGCSLPPHDPSKETPLRHAGEPSKPAPPAQLILITPADGGPVMTNPAGALIWAEGRWTPATGPQNSPSQ